MVSTTPHRITAALGCTQTELTDSRHRLEGRASVLSRKQGGLPGTPPGTTSGRDWPLVPGMFGVGLGHQSGRLPGRMMPTGRFTG